MNKMRGRRFIQGLTQDDLVKATKIDQARISRIERKVIKPTAIEKELLAKVLNCEASELFQEN